MYTILGPEFEVDERANNRCVLANHNAAPKEKAALDDHACVLLWDARKEGRSLCSLRYGASLRAITCLTLCSSNNGVNCQSRMCMPTC